MNGRFRSSISAFELPAFDRRTDIQGRNRAISGNFGVSSIVFCWKAVPGLDQVCINAAAAGEKLYVFPNPAIQTGEHSVICRLSHIPEARLTVKFRGRTPRTILPSDLPSKLFTWAR